MSKVMLKWVLLFEKVSGSNFCELFWEYLSSHVLFRNYREKWDIACNQEAMIFYWKPGGFWKIQDLEMTGLLHLDGSIAMQI